MANTQTDSSIDAPAAPVSGKGSPQDFSREEWWPEQMEKNHALAAMIESWITEGDEQEQSETLETLMRALDEDRLSDRKLFPWLE